MTDQNWLSHIALGIDPRTLAEKAMLRLAIACEAERYAVILTPAERWPWLE